MARRDIATTRGLGLVLPLAPGDTVAVVGDRQDGLVRSLEAAGATVHTAARGAALPAASYDHVVVVGAGRSGSELADALTRCRRGGHALIAVAHRARRWRDREAWRVSGLRRAVRDDGFEVLATYGVRQTLTDVRHLVPLEPGPLAWYLRDVALPFSPRKAALQRLASRTGSRRLLQPSFPAVAVLAHHVTDVLPC